MGKDPAIMFYTSDFLTGTMTFTDEQVGKYIRLLCLQHQKDKLAEKDMLYICKTYDEDIFSKFVKDDSGFYHNKRMQEEIVKRKLYSESRRKNRSKPDKDVSNISKTYVKHMEDENEDENEDVDTKDTKKNKNNISGDVINYLNEVLGSKFRNTDSYKAHINARIKEGATFEEFKTVINKKVLEWKGTEWQKFLRPQTLFGTKFDSYLNEVVTTKKVPGKDRTFDERDYDETDIEDLYFDPTKGD